MTRRKGDIAARYRKRQTDQRFGRFGFPVKRRKRIVNVETLATLGMLTLAACAHQPTGRVSEGGGTFTPPAVQTPAVERPCGPLCRATDDIPGPPANREGGLLRKSRGVIEGTSGDDLLTGTDGDDVICGGACHADVWLDVVNS